MFHIMNKMYGHSELMEKFIVGNHCPNFRKIIKALTKTNQTLMEKVPTKCPFILLCPIVETHDSSILLANKTLGNKISE